jgi:UPF0716 protein FxsA
MRLILFLTFLAFPFLEIAVMIKVGQILGFWLTLGLLMGAAALGIFVIRREGMSMVSRMVDAASQGRMPVAGILDTYAAIVAGCLLIVPGFISDAIGLLLLVPPIRQYLLAAMLPGLAIFGMRKARHSPQPEQKRSSKDPIIIEGTFERLDEKEPPQKG